jgi:anaerobic magnesium-protoporphyrin IX monomethyl ester cyclase
MRERNYDVRVIDLSFDKEWEQVYSLGGERGIFGISFTSSLYSNAKKCIEIIRSRIRHPKIVLGGPHPSVLPDRTLQDMDADVVCVGEAETSFPLVVRALIDGGDLGAIKGIAFRNRQNEVVVNPEMEKIEDLDSLPMPDQSLFPYERYFKEKGFRELSVITSRGCPGRCVFCQPAVQKMFGRKVRQHGSDYIVRQIRRLKHDFRLDFFVISDDTFTANRKKVREFCEKITSEKLNIFWRCQTRIDLLDREMIRTLKKAGCFVVALGVESGSQEILDRLQKNVRLDQIKTVFRVCHEEGMLTHAYLMIGSPGESRRTIAETQKLLKEIKPFSSNICVTTPYPGTYLYETAAGQDLVGDRMWDQYDHLLSDTMHIPIPDFDLTDLNVAKKALMTAQKYPIFKFKCLWKAFVNGTDLKRFGQVMWSNPGILVRGLRLFLKSISSKGLELSNPRTKANRIFATPKT